MERESSENKNKSLQTRDWVVSKNIVAGVSLVIVVAVSITALKISTNEQKGTDGGFALTEEEITRISRSVVAVQCLYDENDDGQWDDAIYGSGIYIGEAFISRERSKTFGEKFTLYDGYVLTNAHVAQLKRKYKEKYDYNFCSIEISLPELEPSRRGIFPYVYDDKAHFLYDGKVDIALLRFSTVLHGEEVVNETSKLVNFDQNLLRNNILPSYPFCSYERVVGKRVYIFGYPSSAFEFEKIESSFLEEPTTIIAQQNLIISEGIISGVNSSGNYYTTARIDTGNSGGLAISKSGGEICLLGVPTWVSEGEYENLGVIQPFSKLFTVLQSSLE